jgi:MFS family permease
VAFIPGSLAVITSFFIKEKSNIVVKDKKRTTLLSFLKYWKESPADYRKLLIGLLAFTLFNSSDVFLLLKAKQSGLSDTMVIGAYIFYNLIYALSSFPLGSIADKIGLKKMYIAGLSVFAMVYFGMGLSNNTYFIVGLFFLYGLYSAATEGISKAWISNISDKKDTATAIGTYSAFQSVCTMLASSFAGLIWYNFGADVTFILTGFVTTIVVVYFLFSFPITKTINA